MNACISIDHGYVVNAYFEVPGEGYSTWHPVFNFGDRQSDAREVKKLIEQCALSTKYADNPTESFERYIRLQAKGFDKAPLRRLYYSKDHRPVVGTQKQNNNG